MPWAYQIKPDIHIVEVSYQGTITASELEQSTAELIALEKREGLTRFLIDVETMELASTASLFDVLNLPARQYVEEGADRSGRVAVLLSESSQARDAARFYETACLNRGWSARVFREREQAISWLRQDAADSMP